MKTYGYLLAAAAVIVTGWGIIAPSLVSANSDILVTAGFCVAAAVPAMLFGIYRAWRSTKESDAFLNRVKESLDA